MYFSHYLYKNHSSDTHETYSDKILDCMIVRFPVNVTTLVYCTVEIYYATITISINTSPVIVRLVTLPSPMLWGGGIRNLPRSDSGSKAAAKYYDRSYTANPVFEDLQYKHIYMYNNVNGDESETNDFAVAARGLVAHRA